jgi:hypothetical protein
MLGTSAPLSGRSGRGFSGLGDWLGSVQFLELFLGQDAFIPVLAAILHKFLQTFLQKKL